MIKLNSVYCEDVISFLKKIDNDSIALAIIDPPYNLNQGDWDTFDNLNDFLRFTYRYLDEVIRVLKDNGSLYIFNTAFNSAFILQYLVSKGLEYKNWITWYKKDGFSACKKKYCNNQETILFFTKSNDYVFDFDKVRVPYLSKERLTAATTTGILKNGKRWYPNSNGKLCTDVWEFPSVRLTNKVNGKTIKQNHPTPKPEPMIERMILASSNESDIVLDLFSGTGTTSFVAKKLKRQYIACDKNRTYCKYIKERLTNDTFGHSHCD